MKNKCRNKKPEKKTHAERRNQKEATATSRRAEAKSRVAARAEGKRI